MSDLTPERLAELRALAEAATPGPWTVESHWEPICGPRETGTTWYIPCLARWHGLPTSVHFGKDEATARYVAAVSPDVVVALFDEIERLRFIVDDVAAEGAPTDGVGVCVWCSDPEAHEPDCAWLKVVGNGRDRRPDATVVAVSDDMPGPEDKVTDLMAALEESVAAAKGARTRRSDP